MFQMRTVFFATLLAILTCYTLPAASKNFANTIYRSVNNHDRVTAAIADVDAAKQRIRVSKGAWYPELDFKLSRGREHIRNPQSDKSDLFFSSASVEATQLLWDFGVTGAKVEKSRLNYLRAQLVLFQTRQDIMLEAVKSAIEIKRSLGVFAFAQRSEQNVRRQTGLEEAKARAGGGLTTDVLQAKTQLAGAQARTIRSKGGQRRALNTYRRFFHTMPVSLKSMKVLESVLGELPGNVHEALEIARFNNPLILIASVDELVAKQSVNEAGRGGFLPRLELVGKAELNRNVGGSVGTKRSASVKIQLSLPFNLGFTSINSSRASNSDYTAATSRLADARYQVDETVLNAWEKYETAKATARLLRDQASLAHAFLKLARQERKLGNRSLIDVLAGESAHFNALSDTLSMDADVLVAAFEILQATGQLVGPDADLVKRTGKKSPKRNRWTSVNLH